MRYIDIAIHMSYHDYINTQQNAFIFHSIICLQNVGRLSVPN